MMMEVGQSIHVILAMARGREPNVTCNEQRSTHKVGKESSEKMKVFGEAEKRTISFDSAFFGAQRRAKRIGGGRGVSCIN